MLTTILIFAFFTSIIFLKSINPLTLGLTLILQTLLMSILLGTMTKSFWIMYLLILTFIGGMLVLFIYVTSIFPNEKFSFGQHNIFISLFLMIMLFFLLVLYVNFFNINLPFNDQIYSPITPPNQSITYTTKMFFSSTSLILIFLVMYLFYCMIVVIKITSFNKGPLRKMY